MTTQLKTRLNKRKDFTRNVIDGATIGLAEPQFETKHADGDDVSEPENFDLRRVWAGGEHVGAVHAALGYTYDAEDKRPISSVLAETPERLTKEAFDEALGDMKDEYYRMVAADG